MIMLYGYLDVILLFCLSQGPHLQILMTAAPTEVHILYPEKSRLLNLSTQKYHYFY